MNKISISELSYYLFFGLLLFAKGIGLYDGQKIFYVFLLTAALFWLIKMVTTSYSLTEFAVIALLGVLGVINWRISEDKSALITIMVIVGLKNIPIKRLFKLSLAIWTVSFFGTITAYALGLHSTYLMVQDKLGGFWLRDSLGQTHPNVLHVCYLVLICLWFVVYEFKGKKLIIASGLALAGSIIVYLFSWSNTGFIMVLAFLIAVIYFEFRTKMSVVEKVGIFALTPIFVCTSLILPAFVEVGTRAHEILYKLTNTRSYLTHIAYEEIPVPLLGVKIENMPKKFSLDCSFAYGLYYWGIILLVVSMIGILGLIVHLFRQKRFIELAMTLAFMFGGMTEQFLYNFSFKNFIWVLLGEYMFVVLEIMNEKLPQKHTVKMISTNIQISAALTDGIYKFKTAWTDALKKHGKSAIIVALVGLLIGGGLGIALIHEPTYLVVNREKSSYVDGKFYYLIYGELDEEIKNDSRKLEINSDEEKCYVFQDETVKFTENRERFGAALYGMAIAVILYGTLVWIKDRKTDADMASEKGKNEEITQ